MFMFWPFHNPVDLGFFSVLHHMGDFEYIQHRLDRGSTVHQLVVLPRRE